MLQCPAIAGHFRGIRFLDPETRNKLQIVKQNVRCKKWSCPVCGPIEKKRLRKRIYCSEMFGFEENKGLFRQKFLTLTFGGRAIRESYIRKYGEKAKDEALRAMNAGWNKLRTEISDEFGQFWYIRTVEKHRDGWPHLHVLMVGRNIAPKWINEFISDYWQYWYGFGFIKLEAIRHGMSGAVTYITKYITKSVGNQFSGARTYSASRGALMKKQRKIWENMEFKFGVARADGSCEEYDVIDGRVEMGAMNLDASQLCEEFFNLIPVTEGGRKCA